ncbi:AMP-dependent synthetase/ligase [Saccharicrinis sp. FJH54]|uniref:AMP-dependent synthetase/ligase n=1 Tax=Saccharicrinis sp. FJH54 TaxID=3344665 RepID=UPI0035D3E54C
MNYDHWGRLLAQKVTEHSGLDIYKWKDEQNHTWKSQTWTDFFDQVNKTALALLDLGVKPGDNVAIWSENMPQWLIADMAVFTVRGVSVPLYANSPEVQAEYILHETESRIVFVGEQEQYTKITAIREKLPSLKQVIVFAEPESPEEPDMSFDTFVASGAFTNKNEELEKRRRDASDDDLATIIYTSGTTGVPKGVMLTHANFAETLRTHEIRLDMERGDSSIAFLPMSHIFERGWMYMCLNMGITIYFNHDPREIQTTLAEVRPTFMCTVPRFWEKVYAAVNENIQNGPAVKKNIFDWALKVGDKYYLQFKRYKKEPGLVLKLQHAIANAIVYSKVKKKAGLENARFFPCAGAAIAPEVATFFHRMGIHLMIGYGLSETTATVTVNGYHNFNLASIGRAMPDLEVKIGENNEIMVKGKTVMKGYYKKPIETAEVFDGEWFKTGDAGYFTEEGDLVMTERIKELYKTATGKYVAPNYIEAKLAMDKYIEQIAVFGDRKKYITALIAPSVQAIKEYAQKMNIAHDSIEELLSHNKITSFFEDRLQKIQKEFARFEQIKKFKLLPYPFTVETGELTSTLKLRRKIIFEKYKELIEGMYMD